MSKPTKKHVRDWMLLLMARQNVSGSVGDLEKQVALSLPSLQIRFPTEAFCQASLDAIAASQRYWNEAAVTQALDAWWRENNPTPTSGLPPEAEAAPFDAEGQHWVAHFYRAETDESAEKALRLIAERAPGPFAYLLRTNMRAADLAVWQHLTPRTPLDLAAEWDDEAGIRRLARKIALDAPGRSYGVRQFNMRGFLLEKLAAVIKFHAPHHGDAFFDELRSIDRGDPVPVAFPAQPEIIEGLFD